jgi:hypothetical protein
VSTNLLRPIGRACAPKGRDSMPDATEMTIDDQRIPVRPSTLFDAGRLLVPRARASSDTVVTRYLRAVRTMTPRTANAPQRPGSGVRAAGRRS